MSNTSTKTSDKGALSTDHTIKHNNSEEITKRQRIDNDKSVTITSGTTSVGDKLGDENGDDNRGVEDKENVMEVDEVGTKQTNLHYRFTLAEQDIISVLPMACTKCKNKRACSVWSSDKEFCIPVLFCATCGPEWTNEELTKSHRITIETLCK